MLLYALASQADLLKKLPVDVAYVTHLQGSGESWPENEELDGITRPRIKMARRHPPVLREGSVSGHGLFSCTGQGTDTSRDKVCVVQHVEVFLR